MEKSIDTTLIIRGREYKIQAVYADSLDRFWNYTVWRHTEHGWEKAYDYLNRFRVGSPKLLEEAARYFVASLDEQIRD